MATLSRFESLALPHMAAAYNRAFWIVRSREDAEDVVQEAYLRAFRAFDDLRGEDIRPWLLTIVRNVAYASAKARNRGLALVPLEEEPDNNAEGPRGARNIAVDEPTAEEAMVRADEHAMVHEALAELPDAMREVVTLREIEGLGYREIADVTGTAVGTVMSRLARGRKVLQSRLSQLMERVVPMIIEHPDEERIGAFVDGELAENDRRDVAAHLEGCPACAADVRQMRALSQRVAAAGPAPMPEVLQARVRAALAAEAGRVRQQAPAGEAPAREGLVRPGPGWMARLRENMLPLAASLLVTAVLSSGATWWAVGGGDRAGAEEALVTHDLLTAHLRALAQDGAIQVASSDSHTVKPWFAGKVDFSPNAPDLAAQGFPLVGGRLDIVDGKRVGALVYRRRLHLVDVFVWSAPTQADTPPSARAEHGYNIVTWSKAGVSYSAVSDLETDELERLAQML